MAIKAIIFDCFGVLTTDGWKAFRSKYFAGDNNLLEKADELSKLSDSGAISFGKFVSMISDMAGVTEDYANDFMNRHERNDELISFMKDELQSKYKIGLLSNVSGDYMEEVIGKEGVEIFDEIVLSYQVGAAKPDKIMYETIVNKLGVNYNECLFIDDQPRYCQGAEVLGIDTILYSNNEQAISEIKAKIGV